MVGRKRTRTVYVYFMWFSYFPADGPSRGVTVDGTTEVPMTARITTMGQVEDAQRHLASAERYPEKVAEVEKVFGGPVSVMVRGFQLLRTERRDVMPDMM